MTTYSHDGSGPSLVLAGGIRTPWASAGRAFAREDAGGLGALVAREAISRTGMDPGRLDEVVAGCVGQPFDQVNLARVIGMRAGVPPTVPARTVARNCASGIEAVTTAAASILAGNGEAALCVGVEVMSAYPLVYGRKMTDLFGRLFRARTLGARLSALASFRPSFLKPRVALLEGLTDPTCGLIMGSTAEQVARDHGVSRESCDALALESHRRAAASREAGRFSPEILPVLPQGAKKGGPSLTEDDSIRLDQSGEKLARLRPWFEKPDGVVTVGNSCGVTDGACALMLMTEGRAREESVEVMARIRGFAWAGLDPARMGLGPVHATARILAETGLELEEMGVIEVNEAFAAQILACAAAAGSEEFARKHLNRNRPLGDLGYDRINPNGGAIALGHPVGATGARLLLTVAKEMALGGHRFGLATLCIGGGQGAAVILEAAK